MLWYTELELSHLARWLIAGATLLFVLMFTVGLLAWRLYTDGALRCWRHGACWFLQLGSLHVNLIVFRDQETADAEALASLKEELDA